MNPAGPGRLAAEVINFLSTADLPAMLASGQLDANQMMLASLGVLLNSGFDIRVALGLHKGCLVIVVPADSKIESVKDLKGKRIGVPGQDLGLDRDVEG